MSVKGKTKNIGKLIVFEGVDGTGKDMQLNLYKKHLLSLGIKFKSHAFPRYNKPSSYFINRYLDDLESPYGDSDDVNPYMASLFYSLDRADAGLGIKRWLGEGYLVVIDRFTGSNVGHQGAKLTNLVQRKKFTDWLFNLEYEILQIPKPDINIVLDNPMSVIEKRLTARQSSDAHEANFEHIENARNSYLWAVKHYVNFKVVSGSEKGRELTPEEVHAKVWKLTQSVIYKTK